MLQHCANTSRLVNLVMLFALLTGLAAGKVCADTPEADVLIIGAGLSGLSSGYYLKKAGKTVHILEMSARLGGRIRTAAYDNYTYAEVGLEEFWESNPAIEILHDLNVPLETAYHGFSSFYYQGRLYAAIQENNQAFLKTFLTPTELQTYRRWDANMHFLHQQLARRPISPELMALKDQSFADWLAETSGLSAKAREFVRIQTEPEFGGSWQQISALDAVAEWDFFSGEGQTPYHVVGGNQLAVAKIADFIGKDSVQLNQLVTHVKSDADGVEVLTIDQTTYQQHVYRAKYLISAIPLYKLNEIQFEPPLSLARKQAIQTQSGGAYFTAHILLDAQASRYWIQNGQSLLPILSDSVLGVIYAGKTQSNQQVLLNLLITGANAEQFNTRITTLDDIKAILLTAFEKQWPGFGQYLKQMFFYRYHPRAIAAWPVGRSRFDELSDSLRQPQGRIYFGGDFSEDTHSNGATVSAQRVVKAILQQESQAEQK